MMIQQMKAKRKALPMVLIILVLYSEGRKRLYIGVGDLRIQYLAQREGSQSTSDNWRLKCTYSLS